MIGYDSKGSLTYDPAEAPVNQLSLWIRVTFTRFHEMFVDA